MHSAPLNRRNSSPGFPHLATCLHLTATGPVNSEDARLVVCCEHRPSPEHRASLRISKVQPNPRTTPAPEYPRTHNVASLHRNPVSVPEYCKGLIIVASLTGSIHTNRPPYSAPLTTSKLTTTASRPPRKRTQACGYLHLGIAC